MVNRQVTDEEKKSVSSEKINLIEKKVKDYITKNNLIVSGDVIVIGVSGGADSLCLLYMLNAFYTDKVTLKVVHVHHGLRKSADEEAEHVRKICKELCVECKIYRADVKKYADENRMSTEEAGRDIRYNAFRELLAGIDNGKIAIAHNKNDNAETLLFNLFRGSSLNGLRGIRANNDNIIRPILCLERNEVEEYLKGRGINYCSDESNDTNDYARNRIRHEILPIAEKTLNSAAIDNMFNFSEDVSSAMDYLDTVMNEKYSCAVIKNDDYIIVLEDEIEKMHSYLQRRIAYKAIVEIAGKMKDIEKKHVYLLLKLFSKQVGRSISLPYDICATKTYEGVEIRKKTDIVEASYNEINLITGKKIVFEGYEVIATKSAISNNLPISKEKYTKWFDCDKIKGLLVCRNPRKGDCIEINEKGDRQSFRRYCINEKIPAQQRKKLMLICDDEGILWIVGRRISSRIKISNSTTNILKIDIKKI